MSDPTGTEFSGKSVEDATAEGLRVLGLRAEDAAIEVINRGSRGLFGIGSEPAVVRVSARSAASAMPIKYDAPDLNADANEVAIETLELGEERFSEDSVDDGGDAVEDAQPYLSETIIEQVVAVPVASASGAVSMTDDSADGATVDPTAVDAEVAAMGVEMLAEMVRLMGFTCTVEAAWHDADDITDERHLLLNVHGAEASGLIGRRGETLENIQYLLRLMVNQRMHRWMNIIVDIEEYRARRVEHLTHLAKRVAQQAVDSGRSQALEPMTPNERRIIHLVLRDDTRVFTESTGDGERRKVVIFPKR